MRRNKPSHSNFASVAGRLLLLAAAMIVGNLGCVDEAVAPAEAPVAVLTVFGPSEPLAVGEIVHLSVEAHGPLTPPPPPPPPPPLNLDPGATRPTVTWTSDRPGIVHVDSLGVATALAPGGAVVTATVGDISATIQFSVSSSATTDSARLVAFYNATGGASWTTSTNWLNADSAIGSWYGVDTANNGRVRNLKLPNNNLTDSLGGSQITGLTYLWSLDLSGNNLTGSIPSGMGDLRGLQELELSQNNLTGGIPGELDSLPNLKKLRLRGNQLTGSIPTWLGTHLTLNHLDLHDNSLTGAIPTELGSLSSLVSLGLGNNSLTGAIPTELGSLSSLVSLGLGNNSLTGAIPTELGSLSNLVDLVLINNSLTGAIPSALGNLTKLGRLDLGQNGLTGSIPAEVWDSLTSLTMLFVNNNSGLTGKLPTEVSNLTSLKHLWVSTTGLSDTLPSSMTTLSLDGFIYAGTSLCSPADSKFQSWLGTISLHVGGPTCASDRQALDSLASDLVGPTCAGCTNWGTDAPLSTWAGVTLDESGWVNSVHLSGAGLSGRVWSGVANMYGLQTLDLSDNELTGETDPIEAPCGFARISVDDEDRPLPKHPGGLQSLDLSNNRFTAVPSLANLASLQSLDLSGNDLKGSVPKELGGCMTDLRYLRLSNIGLTEIPPAIFGLFALEHLDLSGNEISGEIPSELARLTKLRTLDLSGNELQGEIPSELARLTQLRSLDLSSNDYQGEIPSELGDLRSLRRLHLSHNGLTGGIPPELGGLPSLERLDLYGNGLTGGIPPELGSLSRLEYLDLSENGLTGGVPPELGGLAALEDLDLSDNSLAGGIPAEFGGLSGLEYLDLSENGFEGPLPLSLAGLPLRRLHYEGTDLCVPSAASLIAWIESIASHRGTGIYCEAERGALVQFFESAGGADWSRNDNWLTDAALDDWHGVTADANGQVLSIVLYNNGLEGEIPPALGNLAHLETLWLGDNALSGRIPPELGELDRLKSLWLGGNALTGGIPVQLGKLRRLESLWLDRNALSGDIPRTLGWLSRLESLSLDGNELTGDIPPELGDLGRLESLSLDGNALTGGIPPELSGLARLKSLSLDGNALDGPIPPELGGLPGLRAMSLAFNALSGPVPPELGGLERARVLDLAGNPGLSGPLPATLAGLRLDSLMAGGTELCAPRDAAFRAWLPTVRVSRVASCGEAMAYLVQAVQSRTHPVPLVAGEKGLLRVFVTAAQTTTAGMPDVRARFYLGGTETHVAEIAATTTPIPTEVDEGDLSRSANAEIPGRIVRPGLEMVVEIDPEGTLDPDLGVPTRIPEEGRMALDVRAVPVLSLTAIPFLWSEDPDSAVLADADGMAADPDGHPLLEDARTLLPVGAVAVAAHDAVASTSNDALHLLHQTEFIRVFEGGGGHWMGMMSGPVATARGAAFRPGRSSFATPGPGVVAQQLGHNMSLRPAPCGNVGRTDPRFPEPDGSIGAWGYDFAEGRLVPPDHKDLMGECAPEWIGEYHFARALRHRLFDEGALADAGPRAASLLVWGGIDADGRPFLNPAFVADAPASLPDSAGAHALTGRDGDGGELFSLSFAMSEPTGFARGASSFVFALPARAEWADELASITLSGPAGTVALDGRGDRPMAIVLDPASGRVRAVLRGDAAQAAEAAPAGRLRTLLSSGIPDAAAWRR